MEQQKATNVVLITVIVVLVIAIGYFGFIKNRADESDNLPANTLDSIENGETTEESLSETESIKLFNENNSQTTEEDSGIVQSTESTEMTITIFMTKASETENCSETVPVFRNVPISIAVATASINELLKGPAMFDLSKGLVSDVPMEAKLNSIIIENGVAKVDFSKELNSGGGSCHFTKVRAQIEDTLLQFSSVNSVIISVDGNVEEALQP